MNRDVPDPVRQMEPREKHLEPEYEPHRDDIRARVFEALDNAIRTGLRRTERTAAHVLEAFVEDLYEHPQRREGLKALYDAAKDELVHEHNNQ